MKKVKEFNGFAFRELEQRKRMKYVIVTKGDLDINNAYSFESEKKLQTYLDGNLDKTDIQAIFAVEDITGKYL
jgi:hypothetical protein